MPTGYTHELKNMNYDVKKWLKERAIRAMGVCMAVREYGQLNQKEIREHLNNQIKDNWHTSRRKESIQALEDLLKRTESEWHAEMERLNIDLKDRYEKNLKEHNEGLAAHEKAYSELLSMRYKNGPLDEVSEGTLDFAIKQIAEAKNFDFCSPPTLNVYTDIELYKNEIMRGARRDVEYHTEQEAKTNNRTNGMAEAYDKFVEFVDKAKTEVALNETVHL